jgi:hypothetical protein
MPAKCAIKEIVGSKRGMFRTTTTFTMLHVSIIPEKGMNLKNTRRVTEEMQAFTVS